MVLLEHNTKKYLNDVKEYYRVNGSTTEQQIDTMIVLYKQFNSEFVFNSIYFYHKKLLLKMSNNVFANYRRHLDNDHIYDIFNMVSGEFVRRIDAYKFPPVAPFSKYIKSYISLWANSYVKLMAKKEARYISIDEITND